MPARKCSELRRDSSAGQAFTLLCLHLLISPAVCLPASVWQWAATRNFTLENEGISAFPTGASVTQSRGIPLCQSRSASVVEVNTVLLFTSPMSHNEK